MLISQGDGLTLEYQCEAPRQAHGHWDGVQQMQPHKAPAGLLLPIGPTVGLRAS